MPLILLDSENADRNLTSTVTCLTHTPDANHAIECQGLIYLGDGTKNLVGTAGVYEFTVTVGGQTIQPSPQNVQFSTAARSAIWTTVFPVPVNNEVILRVKSPHSGDSDVDVTAYLYEVTTAAPWIYGSISDAGADANDFDAASGLSATDDFYNGMTLVFTTGTYKGLRRTISDYTGASRNIVLSTDLPGSPANGDDFIIV